MRVLTRLSVSACLLASLALAGSAAVASAATGTSPVTGHVYLDDNTAPVNTIAGYARHADGSLTALPGSPFSAGGAGSGAGNASQGSIQLVLHGRYVLAVDNGSNQISVLAVHSDGSLALVGSPVASGGLDPVSIAVAQHLVYVANAGVGRENYTGFRLSAFGRLSAIAGSTVALPDTAQPGDVLFNATGTNLIGTEVNASTIDSFAVGADGRLTAAADSPFAAQGVGPFGSAFRPNYPSQLFVSNAHGGTNNGTVSAFNVAGDGTLTSIGGSPFADLQTAPCWVAISPDGQFLYTVNTAVPSISSYSIAPSGALTLIGTFPFRDGAGLAPADPQISPNGRYLYVDGSGNAIVSGFAIDRGFVKELPSSPTTLPQGATASGIAVS